MDDAHDAFRRKRTRKHRERRPPRPTGARFKSDEREAVGSRELVRVGYWRDTGPGNTVAGPSPVLDASFQLGQAAGRPIAGLLFGLLMAYADSTRPDPRELVAPYQPADKARVLRHLRAGRVVQRTLGYSYCRFHCGVSPRELGSACLTDGVYRWPEGLAHYVDEHDVQLPAAFIAHIKSGARR